MNFSAVSKADVIAKFKKVQGEHWRTRLSTINTLAELTASTPKEIVEMLMQENLGAYIPESILKKYGFIAPTVETPETPSAEAVAEAWSDLEQAQAETTEVYKTTDRNGQTIESTDEFTKMALKYADIVKSDLLHGVLIAELERIDGRIEDLEKQIQVLNDQHSAALTMRDDVTCLIRQLNLDRHEMFEEDGE